MEAGSADAIRSPQGCRWRPRPLRLAGAAAVAAAIIATAMMVGLQAGGRPLLSSLTAPTAMPRYYLTVGSVTMPGTHTRPNTLNYLDAVVRDSASGYVTGAVRLPGISLSSLRFVAAAADGRTFVIAVDLADPLIMNSDDWRFFRLTVSARGRPGQPTLARAPAHIPVTNMTLSPDATMLAVSLALPTTDEFVTYGGLAVINLATGQTRTWTARGDVNDWPGTPTWTRGDSQVSFPWWHRILLPANAPEIERNTQSAVIAGLRVLDVSAPGTSLLQSRLFRFPAAVRDLRSAVVTSDGRDIMATLCRDRSPSGARHRTAVAQTVDLSAADGRLVRVLRTQTATFAGYQEEFGAFTTCDVLSVAAAGQHVLVQAFSFGRIDGGVFTALPGPFGVTAAW